MEAIVRLGIHLLDCLGKKNSNFDWSPVIDNIDQALDNKTQVVKLLKEVKENLDDGKFKKAEELSLKINQLEPRNPDALSSLIWSAFEQGNLKYANIIG